MIAVLRIHSWNLPLFLHVLGATVLFGGMITTTVLAVAARNSQHRDMLARLTFRTLLFVVLPSWVLTRVAGQWILDRENNLFHGLDNKGWVGVGFLVTEGGLVLLLITGFLAWRYARKGGRAGEAVVALSGLYLVALAVAWFAMSAKPGS